MASMLKNGTNVITQARDNGNRIKVVYRIRNFLKLHFNRNIQHCIEEWIWRQYCDLYHWFCEIRLSQAAIQWKLFKIDSNEKQSNKQPIRTRQSLQKHNNSKSAPKQRVMNVFERKEAGLAFVSTKNRKQRNVLISKGKGKAFFAFSSRAFKTVENGVNNSE
eukprot:278146_1